MKPTPGRLRVVRPSQYVLIVDGEAPFATQLTSELAAVGVATRSANDTYSAKQLLARLSPPPVVIDLRYAGLPMAASLSVKP